MNTLLTVSLPLAIGAALSPMLFAATTGLLSGTDRPRRRALAFLIGALVPLGILVAVAFTAVGPAIQGAVRDVSSILGAIDLVLGSLLLAVAAWFAIRPPHRRAPKPRRERPLWWDGLLGVVLQGRDVSSMLLAYASLQHAAVAHVSDAAKTVAAAAIVVIVTLPIWLPIVARVSVPPRLRARLERGQGWIERHERPIVIAVCLGFGTYLVVRGALGK